MAGCVVPYIDLESCTRCGVCVDVCPAEAVVMGLAGPEFSDPEACTYCTLCETLCPEGAIACGFVIVWEGDSRRGADGPEGGVC